MIIPEDEENVSVKEFELRKLQKKKSGSERGERKVKGDKKDSSGSEDRDAVENESSGLTDYDFVFLLGLGLFIVFLVLSHPSTPGIAHGTLIFWMSITMLFLSIAPDYVNEDVAEG